MAEKLGISNGYLSTLLNQNLQCGFVDYLNQVRIDRACSYLEQNYLKNYEIAYKVGFRALYDRHRIRREVLLQHWSDKGQWRGQRLADPRLPVTAGCPDIRLCER